MGEEGTRPVALGWAMGWVMAGHGGLAGQVAGGDGNHSMVCAREARARGLAGHVRVGRLQRGDVRPQSHTPARAGFERPGPVTGGDGRP